MSSSIDLLKFYTDIPSTARELISLLNGLGWRVAIVGGTTRDYLLNKKIGKDFDIELHYADETDIEQNDLWEELQRNLDAHYIVDELDFNVFRIQEESITFEVSPVRIEKFDDTESHKNFLCDFVPHLPYEESLLRRDFTINAIVFEFYHKERKVIDPLGGIEHLFKNELHPCGQDFPLDPVRILRAFRFKHRLHFNFSDKLEEIVEEKDELPVTNYYLNYECKKSKKYVACLNDLAQNFPNSFGSIKFIEDSYQELDDLWGKLNYGFPNNLSLSISMAQNLNSAQKEDLLKFLGIYTKRLGVMLKEYNFAAADRVFDYLINYNEFDEIKEIDAFDSMIRLARLLKRYSQYVDLKENFYQLFCDRFSLKNIKASDMKFIDNTYLKVPEEELEQVLENERNQYVFYKILEMLLSRRPTND